MENTKSHFIEIESHEGKDLIIKTSSYGRPQAVKKQQESLPLPFAAPKTSTPPMKETFPHS